MVVVRELNHVALNVCDLEKACRFYGEVVALPVLERPAFSFGGAWYALGSQELHLIEAAKTTADPERHKFHFALRVDDLTEAKHELEQRGVNNISGPAPRPDGVYQIFFQDPDGNVIEMMAE
jgi:catechol 2,3-dioxygenase-like lactoylglutathione lyase family enzyme